ncbi:MAG TPA: hypothetical protein V6C52_12355 [Coleofasciculaceae cyanobacterium]
MNQTLSAMAAQPKGPAPRSSEGPPSRAPRTSSRPSSRSSEAPRGRTTGGYRSPEMSGGPATLDQEQSYRFAGKKKSPSRPKGKLPPKKGDGYPKKPR